MMKLAGFYQVIKKKFIFIEIILINLQIQMEANSQYRYTHEEN